MGYRISRASPHGGNTQLKTTFQSRGGCSRPQNRGAAVLKRRPTSVLPQDKPFAQSDGLRQTNEATMSTKYDSTRGISEWNPVYRLALHDHRQLRRHSP